MKKISILCLLLLSALMMLVGCKADPEAFNNIPTLRLGEPTDLLRTSVTLHGSLQTDYPGHIREYGFLFSSSIDFTSSDTQTIPVTEGSTADITASVSGLTIGETYFYALYATTGGEKMLSEVASVTMPTRSGATISKPEIVDLYIPSLRAEVTDDGGSTINGVGFCWSTSPNPTIFTGEHETAHYDAESRMISADLTKIKGRESYYIRAFVESDVTGAGNMSISYGEAIELNLKHKVTLEAINATTTTLTFALNPFNCDEIKWLLKPKSEAGGITADQVLSEGTSAHATQRSEVTVENLKPESPYTVFAVAVADGEAVLSDPIEMTTGLAPTVELEAVAQDYTSITFAVTSANAEEVKYLFLSEEELTAAGKITAQKVLAEGTEIEANRRVATTKFDLPSNKTYYVYTIARSGNFLTPVFYLEFFTANTPKTWRIYYTSTDDQIVEPYDVSGFGANIVSNTYENGQGVIIFDREVTSIGCYAFAYCDRLTNITIPNMVFLINDGAFSNCTNLTKITIPNSVIRIDYIAFYGCSSLTSVTIPDNVLTIGDQAFWGCSSLTSVTIPDNVLSIGNEAFFSCSSLTSVTIGDSVTSIGDSAFWNCTSLTSITIPDSVTSIGAAAFRLCTGLTSITIPDSVTSIGDSAFFGCSGLTSVTIPDSVTSIGEYTFYECSGLTSVTIPDSVVSIGSCAFSGCSSLTSITIPDSVTSIGDSAFRNCTSLTSISIPDSVTSIGDSAFWNCTGLTSVTIGNGVISIGWEAFYGCTSLTSITIPDSVTSIGESAFSQCTGLTSVTIGNGVTSIGWEAFYGCTSLTSITIPDSVTSIGQDAFYRCTSLTSVYCKPTTPPTGYSSMFDNNASGRKIYVPNASVEAYKAAKYWSSYASDIVGYDF